MYLIQTQPHNLTNWCLSGASSLSSGDKKSKLPNTLSQVLPFSVRDSESLLQQIYMNENLTEAIQFSSVNNQLRSMTESYLNSHKGLTLNALAGRSGVPATTMRRLMQEDQRSELAPHSVLALVSYLLKEKKISKILKVVEGPVAELLTKCFDQFIFDEEKSNHEMLQDLNTLFQDKLNYLIYKMAANVCGTTLEDVKDGFGLLGLKKLNELMSQGWILADSGNGRLHAKQKNFSVDLALAHELSHSLINLYKPCDVKSGLNLFYSLSEGMSKEGIQKIKEIEKEAVKKIFEVMNTKDMQGEIPYFALIVSDVMGATPSDSGHNGVYQ